MRASIKQHSEQKNLCRNTLVSGLGEPIAPEVYLLHSDDTTASARTNHHCVKNLVSSLSVDVHFVFRELFTSNLSDGTLPVDKNNEAIGT